MFRRVLFVYSILFAVLVSGVLLGVYLVNVGYVPIEKLPASIQQEIAVDLTIDYAADDLQSFPSQILVGESTVLDLLELLEKRHGVPIETRNFPGLGQFIEAIHGVHNTNNLYWQYWVNDEYAKVGASQYVLQDGDTVLWKRTDQSDILE